MNSKAELEARVNNLEIMVHLICETLLAKDVPRETKELSIRSSMDAHLAKSQKHGGFLEIGMQ